MNSSTSARAFDESTERAAQSVRSRTRALRSFIADRTPSLAFALLIGIGLACAACSRSNSPATTTSIPKTSPQRIVALTIGAVDTLALLGELGRVIAVEEDCFVPGTEHMTKIRNDDHSGPSKALNVESVLALQPDLVIAKEDLKPALENRGLHVLWLPAANGLDVVVPLVEQIGDALGVPDKSRALVAAMHAKMAAIEARVANLPKVRVYYEAGKPGRTAGRGTVIDDMIRLAGGVNIAGDLGLANPVLSTEAILAADPEVIVLSPWCDSPDEVAARPGWNRTLAVKNGRVHRIPERDRKVQYTSPSCVDGCETMLVPWLHPTRAGEGAR